MTLWIVLTVLCLAALGFIAWPLYKKSGQLTGLMATVIILMVGLTAGLYHFIGSPGAPSGAGGGLPDVNEIVTSLEERLQESPDDVEGWLTLGRSYQTMERFDDAIAAFEKAVELEEGQNAQTLVALSIALMAKQGGQISERSSSLFENALALDPNNSNALFYSGGAAAQQGDTLLAADRWELLLQQNAPPEIQEMLQRKINEWRGVTPPMAGQMPEPAAEQGAEGISISLSLSDAARSALPENATIFVIARDPAQPSPPIAVTPQRLSELPMVVSLTDQDAMVAGRLLSGFAELEIVARVSLSGQPMAQSDDWYGSQIVTAGTESIELIIDQQVP